MVRPKRSSSIRPRATDFTDYTNHEPQKEHTIKTKHHSTLAIRHSAFTALGAAFVAALTLFTTSPRAPAQTVWTNALSFDGVNDYVAISNFGSSAPTNEVTIEFWQNVAAAKGQVTFATVPDQNNNRILAHVPFAGGIVYWDFGNINGNAGRLSYTPPAAITNSWQHFALVASQSGNFMRLYRNGVLEASKTGMTPFVRGAYDLQLGGIGTSFFGGQLDEFRVWKVARSQAEIVADMNRPLTGAESNLVAYYRFDEGAGLIAYDATTNHLDGTLMNGPVWTNSAAPLVPVVTTGAATNITARSATLQGLVNPGSLPATAWFEWGATTNYGSTTATTALSATNLALLVSQPLSGLIAGTSYHFRLVATNHLRTNAGADSVFTSFPVRCVDAGSTNPTPPYTNWATAATNIQDALNAAVSGDEIVVTNGSYGPVSVTQAIAVRSVNGPAFTLINGGGTVRCVYLADGASLSGFTLTNGSAASGGGVSCASSNATVSNCVLIGNSATDGGGASSGTLNNCVLTGNSASRGGGAYGSTLNNCTLTGNSATSRGGGGHSSTLNNCSITGNSASLRGGGAYNGTLNNCIVYFNTAPVGANYFVSSSTAGILNYCCTTPMPTNGVGNITLDPELASPSHLSASSPCRGAGSAAYATGTDLDGEAWANPPAIGCDESFAGAVTGPLTVAIAATHTNVAVGYPVTLSARIDGRTTASAWDFGAGIVLSNQPYATHAWAAPGDYPVILRAWNESLPGGVSATVIIHVATPPVHYVAPASPNPVPPYTTWDTAATNLQDAVNALGADILPGTWVLATNGTYAPVSVTGRAFLRSVNGPEFTTINGGGVARCVYLAHGAGLSGFTLTNGSADSGGGVRCASASVWISDCVVTGNRASADGGGAYWGTLDHCTLVGNRADGTTVPSEGGGGGARGSILNYCTLTGNTDDHKEPLLARGGGGAADATLNYCTLDRNSVTNRNGGFRFGGGASFSTLNHCLLTRNKGGDKTSGGGAYASTLNDCTLSDNGDFSQFAWGGGAHSSSLNHCTLSGNLANEFGGGAYSCTLNHCTLTGNQASDGAGAHSSTLNNCILGGNAGLVGVGAHSSTLNNCTLTGNLYGAAFECALNNCIVYYNSGGNYTNSTLNYCCTTPLPASGVGNITNEPAFLDLAGGNLRLQTNSPCINAGANAYAPGSTDLDGRPRIVNGTVDLGAYEFQPGVSGLFIGWLQQYALPTDGSADYTDFDGDRLNNWQEWRCLTVPTNSLSVLRLLSASRAGTNVTVLWESVAGVSYFLERCADLASAPYFTPLATNLPGQPGTTTFTHTNAAALSPSFYRVGVGD